MSKNGMVKEEFSCAFISSDAATLLYKKVLLVCPLIRLFDILKTYTYVLIRLSTYVLYVLFHIVKLNYLSIKLHHYC